MKKNKMDYVSLAIGLMFGYAAGYFTPLFIEFKKHLESRR